MSEPTFEFYGDRHHWSGHCTLTAGLDSCPFCGGVNIEVSNTHTPYYTARCQDCEAEGPKCGPNGRYKGGHSRTKKHAVQLHREALKNAVEAWNDRH